MVTSMALAIALWPTQVTQYCPPSNDTLIVGVAFNNQNEFLYCELFSQISEKKFHSDYIRESNTFATKDLDFSNSLFLPDVTQLDFRSGELREATINKHQVNLKYREEKNRKDEQVNLARNEMDALDAGFNDFIRAHWDELITGNTLTINFGSIAHQKTLPLRISQRSSEKCGNILNKECSPAPFCFMIEIDNMFLRLLVGNIKLTYDKQHRLQEFNGTVNIQNNKQKSQNAIIHYYYNNDYLPVPNIK